MDVLKLEGQQLFIYLMKESNSSLSGTLKSMEDVGQNMAWFYTSGKGRQVAIRNDDPYLTDYLKGNTICQMY